MTILYMFLTLLCLGCSIVCFIQGNIGSGILCLSTFFIEWCLTYVSYLDKKESKKTYIDDDKAIVPKDVATYDYNKCAECKCLFCDKRFKK